MSHLVSYWWFRRTQYITSIGLIYKNVGILLVGCLTREELVGVLTGENGAEMLISAFRSRRSISGPEMDV